MNTVQQQAFPSELYRRVDGEFNCRSLLLGSDPFEMGRQFTGAWYGMELRWQDCSDASQKFVTATHGILHPTSGGSDDSGDYVKRTYVQDRELFSFLYLGLSALETLVYGMFFVAARRYPEQFPIKFPRSNPNFSSKRKPLELRPITLDKISARLCEEFPADPLSEALREICLDTQLKDWKQLRNEFTHRLTPHRHSFVIDQASRETFKSQNNVAFLSQEGEFLELTEELSNGDRRIRLDELTTSSRFTWLTHTLTTLVTQCKEFIDRHYPDL